MSAYTLQDKVQDVREVHPLWDWARDQAAAVANVRQRAAEERKRLDEVTAIVEESMEWKDAEECREALKDARKAAVERDDDVISATENLAAARKKLKKVAAVNKQRAIKASVKALETVGAETKDRLAEGLASGKIPSAIEVDPTVVRPASPELRRLADNLARVAGPGGSLTITAGGESATIVGR